MKKFILLFLFATPLLGQAQDIPNGNFESWFWLSWFENPESWETDNTQLQNTVTKDYDSYEGEFAMRVEAVPTSIGEYGEASTQFEITAVPAALNFYAKSAVEFGGVGVTITFLNQDSEIYTEYWFSSDNMEEYTLVSIPLDQIEPVISHVRIAVSAHVGDLVAGSAWISVDAMEFGEPLKTKQPALTTFNIYPNPTSDNLTIQSSDGSLGNIKITDVQSKIVFEDVIKDNLTTINVENFSPGVYTISSDKPNTKASTFIVQ